MTLTIIATILGIIGTFIAYKFNPKNRIYAEVDASSKDLIRMYRVRDKALAENDNDTLTKVTSDILALKKRIITIVERL